VHPLERLRFVARSADAESPFVVEEAAVALAELAAEGASLVLACRQLCSMLPENGALWTLACRVLGAEEPVEEAWRLAVEQLEEVERDLEPGLDGSGGSSPAGLASLDVGHALMAGPDGVLVSRPGRSSAASSSTPLEPVVVAVGPLRLLPGDLFRPLAARLGSGRPTPSGRRCRVLGLGELDGVVLGGRWCPPGVLASARPDCEVLPDVAAWAAALG